MFTGKMFYHIYPFGFCGAPWQNDFASPAGTGLRSLIEHIPHLLRLGINAVYIGPLFESTAHGYDTLDYFWADRRLGTNDDLKALTGAYHDAGIAVVFDAVLNHSGRHFFAFRDLLQNGEASPYRDWYANVDFSRRSPWGDPFSYNGWAGCFDLAQFNSRCRAVRDHLFKAVEFWINEFDIDGLRLDAAAELAPDFMDELSAFCKSRRPGFWLMGEVVGGDYRNWARAGRLDSVTNYEMYKGLWSSFNDRNFFEIAWTLNRQFGTEGLYRHIDLYNFVDNHDVNRVASSLSNTAHLFPLYGLLCTVPGIPSIYYGSEFGIRGERSKDSDRALRPRWNGGLWERSSLAGTKGAASDGAALFRHIAALIRIRRENPALQRGAYRQLALFHEQFAFIREGAEFPSVVVAVNSAGGERSVTVSPGRPRLAAPAKRWTDLLTGETFDAGPQGLLIPLGVAQIRILREER
jgi:glycosidase